MGESQLWLQFGWIDKAENNEVSSLQGVGDELKYSSVSDPSLTLPFCLVPAFVHTQKSQ